MVFILHLSRIQQLESELEENAKDREILQQEVKTALEINIENAKQFEKQVRLHHSKEGGHEHHVHAHFLHYLVGVCT